MTDSDDKRLHDAVRQTLADYRPPFEPGDWEQMRRALRRRHWRRAAGWLGAGLLLLLTAWWVAAPERPTTPPPALPTARSSGEATPAGPVSRPMANRPVRPAPVKRPASSLPAYGFTHGLGLPTPARTAPERTVLPEVYSLAPKRMVKLLSAAAGTLPPVVLHSPDEPEIIRQVTTGAFGSDSTVFRVLTRNLRKWPNAVIVCDFTSSMYPYSTQLMAWLRRNQTNRQVQGIALFTDCDSLGREVGSAGGGQVFITRGRTVQEVLPLMLASARNTMSNREDAESNIDALLTAQRQFPNAQRFILVADNSSAVKDMNRLTEVIKPVHVILCGSTYNTTAFGADYLTIAQRTNGSLHTLEDDLTSVVSFPRHTWIRSGHRYYRLNRRGRFVPTAFTHRPRRWLGVFWK